MQGAQSCMHLGVSDNVIRVCTWYFHTYFVLATAKRDVQHAVVPSMLPQQQSNTDSLFRSYELPHW